MLLENKRIAIGITSSFYAIKKTIPQIKKDKNSIIGKYLSNEKTVKIRKNSPKEKVFEFI